MLVVSFQKHLRRYINI